MKRKLKRIIILSHNGGRLANQLWNYLNVYSYCRHRDYDCVNYSFFDYARSFPNADRGNCFLWLPRQLRSLAYYRIYVPLVHFFNKENVIDGRNVISEENPYPFYLPPSAARDGRNAAEVARLEKMTAPRIYFCGWLFRNPAALAEDRAAIVEYFRPQPRVEAAVRTFIEPLRKRFASVVGVHIRQTDYATFEQGRYFLTEDAVAKILREYLAQAGKRSDEVIFVICSDAPVDLAKFSGLNVVRSQGDLVEDLFTLAATDVVIGSNSTYGALAAYMGDNPFIVLEKDPIDWAYYRGRDRYFENDKCTMACY